MNHEETDNENNNRASCIFQVLFVLEKTFLYISVACFPNTPFI